MAGIQVCQKVGSKGGYSRVPGRQDQVSGQESVTSTGRLVHLVTSQGRVPGRPSGQEPKMSLCQEIMITVIMKPGG